MKALNKIVVLFSLMLVGLLGILGCEEELNPEDHGFTQEDYDAYTNALAEAPEITVITNEDGTVTVTGIPSNAVPVLAPSTSNDNLDIFDADVSWSNQRFFFVGPDTTNILAVIVYGNIYDALIRSNSICECVELEIGTWFHAPSMDSMPDQVVIEIEVRRNYSNGYGEFHEYVDKP